MTITHLTSRVWVYSHDQWEWGRWGVTTTGSDEFGRLTVVLRLPGRRALVWAYRTCRCEDCGFTREQTAQGETDLRRVCDFYGVDEDTAWDLPGDDWNRALTTTNEEPA